MKLLKFYADWCKPCATLSKTLEHFTLIPIVPLNVDVEQELSVKYSIRNLPTVILVDENNKELFRRSGLVTISELHNKINEFS